MTLPNGYKMQTTFFLDFAIADKFGISAVQDTFNRSFNSYKNNHIYLTEIAIVMSNKSCEWYQRNTELSNLYSELYHKVDEYCMTHLKDKELNFYITNTD